MLKFVKMIFQKNLSNFRRECGGCLGIFIVMCNVGEILLKSFGGYDILFLYFEGEAHKMSDMNILKKRWFYLAVGVFAMLFSGVLYAWSILKVPFKEDFGWPDAALALNFTLTMTFFCLSAFAGSLICKRFGPRVSLILAGVLVGAVEYLLVCGYNRREEAKKQKT